MDIPDIVKKKLIELDSENQQLRQDLAKKKADLEQRDQLLAEYEEELNRVSSTPAETVVEYQKADTSRMDELLAELELRETELSDLRVHKHAQERTIEELRKELQYFNEAANLEQSRQNEPSNSAELAALQDERDEAVFKLDATLLQLEAATAETKQLQAIVSRKDEELSDLNGHMRSLNGQISELQCQLNQQQMESVDFKSRGNSMFGEFVDERKRLEHEMKELFMENRQLRRLNVQLRGELEEASLSCQGGSVMVPSRCKCDELSAYVISIESKLAEQVLKTNYILNTASLSVERDKNQDVWTRNFVRSQRSQLTSLEKDLKATRTELRESLDETANLRVQVQQLKHSNDSLKMETERVRTQMNMQKARFEREMNPEVEHEPERRASEQRASAPLGKPTILGRPPVQHATPASKPTKKITQFGDIFKTPAAKDGFDQSAKNMEALLNMNESGCKGDEDLRPTLTARERRQLREKGNITNVKPQSMKKLSFRMERSEDGTVKMIEEPKKLADHIDWKPASIKLPEKLSRSQATTNSGNENSSPNSDQSNATINTADSCNYSVVDLSTAPFDITQNETSDDGTLT